MTSTTSGILKLTKKGGGVLYNPANSREQPFVPEKLIREYKLIKGATIVGSVQENANGPQIETIESICGVSPEAFLKRPTFKKLVAIHPTERFNLAVSGDTSTRLIDLVSPIGKGTRGLIVSPPKAGKTMMMEKIALAIRTSEPDTRLIVLLIDERPEEVTHLRRSIIGAEVFASSSDQPIEEHTELSQLMLAHVRAELECGHNVVILVDSLTRLVRAFNLRGSRRGRGRTLSGGVEAGSLEIPRRFFGLARNVENGGSVTIIATILIDTGSRMDDYIFEEFKGTGNSEIILSRDLAQAYIFPAIDLLASSTRREEYLYNPDDMEHLRRLRKRLSSYSPKEAMQSFLTLLDKYPTNEELLQSFARKR